PARLPVQEVTGEGTLLSTRLADCREKRGRGASRSPRCWTCCYEGTMARRWLCTNGHSGNGPLALNVCPVCGMPVSTASTRGPAGPARPLSPAGAGSGPPSAAPAEGAPVPLWTQLPGGTPTPEETLQKPTSFGGSSSVGGAAPGPVTPSSFGLPHDGAGGSA